MAFLSFPIEEFTGANALATITLTEVGGGIEVTVNVDETVAAGDITGVFFDVAENAISDLSVFRDGKVVTATAFQVNDVLKVGRSTIEGGIAPFDAGVAIGSTSAKDFFDTATFTVQNATLEDFIGQRIGVRLQSIPGGKSSKLVGTVPPLPVVQKGTIGDRVFLDVDADGIQDANESGVADVTVKLLNRSGTVLDTTTTEADGSYSFKVNPGEYQVEFDAPTGFFFTAPNQEADDAFDSDANPSNGRTGFYTIAPGETNFTVDAGLQNVDVQLDKKFIGLDQYLIDPEGGLNLELTKVAEPIQGSPITFQIQVSNSGQTKATNVNVTDTLDERLLIKTVTVDNPAALVSNTSSGQNLDLVLTLNPGETRTITVTTEVNFPEGEIFPLKLRYLFGSDNPFLEEYHNVELKGTMYTSATDIVKSAGSTLISFNPFAPVDNTASVSLLGIGAIDANPSNNSDTDSFRFLRLFLEGVLNDGITPILEFSLGPLTFDVDPLKRSSGYVLQHSDLLGDGDVGEYTTTTYWEVSNSPTITAFETETNPLTAFTLFKQIIEEGTYGIGKSRIIDPKTGTPSSTTIERILDVNEPQTLFGSQTISILSAEIRSEDAPIVTLIANANLQAQLDAQPLRAELTGYRIIIPSSLAVGGTFTTSLTQLNTFFNNNNYIDSFVVEPGINKVVFGNNTTAANLDASSFTFVSSNPNLQIIFKGINLKDSIIGTQRNETIYGLNGNDELWGRNGNDTIDGGAGSDTLNGEAGNDTLVGGGSKDILIGGSGDDTLTGGTGPDTFVFTVNSGNDRITDFDKDLIDLSQFGITLSDLNVNTSGSSATFIDGADSPIATVQNGNLLLNLTSFGGGIITVARVSSIPTSAFIL